MKINNINPYTQNNQTSFKAVNQKYFEWAKKDFKLEKSVSCDWLDNIDFDIFLFKTLSKRDAIDTVDATKKYLKDNYNKTCFALEDLLKRLKNYH